MANTRRRQLREALREWKQVKGLNSGLCIKCFCKMRICEPKIAFHKITKRFLSDVQLELLASDECFLTK